VKDFIMDEYFQSWVFTPDGKTESFWQAWLDENPNQRSTVEEARSTLLQLNFSSYNLSSKDVSTLWDEIKKSSVNRTIKPKLSSSKSILWYSGIAATLLLFISFFLASRPGKIEYETAFGETKSISLPDGSTVILNSNSVLELKSTWDSEQPREVWLKGEAFFSVVHKRNNQPFTVRTEKDVNIEVLGTTFNVYNRSETKVMLNTGSIRLSLPATKSKEKILMKPGELVEYDEEKFVKRKVDPKVYTAWTEHNLVLNRTSLRELLNMLKDNYGVAVEVRDGLLDETISGSMPVTDGENLLQQIAKAFQLNVVREGDKIFLKE
jgi:ferric-dicitrate binding protein FerR (iron transport regulator)